MAIIGVANLAVKVRDLEAAVAFYRRSGASVTDPQEWRNGLRADVHLGPLQITLFTRPLYEDVVELPADGFLPVALFSDDPEKINRVEKELASITPELLRENAREYLRPGNRTILTVETKAEGKPDQKPEPTPAKSGL